MKSHVSFLLLTFCTGAVAADKSAIDFSGHYELAKSSKAAFALEVEQKGKTATISFSAAHQDGSGAAPDGDGKGRLNPRGELEFKFSDSFENTGSATLRRDGKSFRLSMEMTKVVEPRAVVFYGDLLLKRVRRSAN